MKIHLAGTTVCSPECDSGEKIQQLFTQGNKLHSYFHSREERGFEYNWFNTNMKNNVSLFLDSGAFSAFTQGVVIDIQEYIDFIKENEEHLEVYANLDVIGDPKQTWKNQKTMERAGLSPLPCFHYGDDIKWLQRYLREYDYLALGGMVPISTKGLILWLDEIFGKYICDEDGSPKVKTHGFGLTSLKLMMRYPWFSVDSTSWVVTGRMGTVLIPREVRGELDYMEEPFKVCVSSRSPTMKQHGKHITSFSPLYKKRILQYIESMGFEMGHSQFREEHHTYQLQEGEKWCGKPDKHGNRPLEKIITPGLSNDYRIRDELNIQYYLNLEQAIPPYPRKFQTKSIKKLKLI